MPDKGKKARIQVEVNWTLYLVLFLSLVFSNCSLGMKRPGDMRSKNLVRPRSQCSQKGPSKTKKEAG